MTNGNAGRRRLLAGLGLAVGLATLGATPAGASTSVRCDDRAIEGQGVQPYRSAGTYCRPATGSPRAMVVLVPGGTYNRAYWDFPYRPDTYSFSRALARAGYASFALDRLGTGGSSKPLSVFETGLAQGAAIHQVVERLRSDGFDGRRFETVMLGGHSGGSIASVLEAATYRDVDGVLVTGHTHRIDALTFASLFAVRFHPAALDPKFRGRKLDPLYNTTRPGMRYAAFHAPGKVEQGVIDTDEATKDVSALGEAPDSVALGILLPYTARIEAPVYIALGQRDPFLCGSLATDCSSPRTVLAQERPYYRRARCVDALVMPGSGHDINLHPSAPTYQAASVRWLDALTSGGCPDGAG